MAKNPFNLVGKTILITGASSGIGRTTAIECSKLGATIIVSGRNEERLRDTLNSLEGEGHNYVCADLTIENEMKSLVDSLSSIDGVVLCSGKGMMLPVQFSTREKFLDVLDTNFLYPIE